MGKGKPRIEEAHYLDPSAVEGGMHTGEWVRVNQYAKSHRVGANGTDAYCGRPLLVDYSWWEDYYRPLMASRYEADPGEWWIAEEHRVDSNTCTPCRSTDRSEIAEDAPDGPQPPVPTPTRPISQLTPSERLMQRRNYAAVIRIARELDAEVLSE